MKTPSRLSVLRFCALAACLPVIAGAQDNDISDSATPASPATAPEKPEIFRENLINNSPFRAVSGRRNTAQQPLELHGFVGNGKNLEVSLTNPGTRECRWVRLRDENAKWFVESADPEKRTAVVRLDGVSLNLEMVHPNETPLSITPATGATATATGTGTVQQANMPAGNAPQQPQQRTPRSFRSGSSGANTGSSGEAVAPASASGNTGGNNPSGGGRRRNRSN